MRTRTVSWIEGRILEVLGKVKGNNYPIPLALSAMAMGYEIRSLEEQGNYDLALLNVLRGGLVIECRDEKGFQVYKLAA
jgi:hypothetical protein